MHDVWRPVIIPSEEIDNHHHMHSDIRANRPTMLSLSATREYRGLHYNKAAILHVKQTIIDE